jgi:hypothetical protein
MELALSPSETYRELLQRGYTLRVSTRTELGAYKDSVQVTRYADKLLVSGGPGPLEGELREAVKAHKPQLLAAVCAAHPPEESPWLLTLTDHYLMGEHLKIRGHKHAFRFTLGTVAANVAAFIGLDPVADGPRFEAIIAEALT